MPNIAIPSDLAAELTEAMHWYRAEPAMKVLVEQIQAEHPWAERRPRWLLAWATRHAIPVFGHKRFLQVLSAGFDCPERWRLWRAAKAELRRARAAIARGEEAGMIYSGGRDLLVFADSEPRRWGAPENVLLPSLHASPAGPMPEAAPQTEPPPSPSPPQLPRGQWITRTRAAT
jgi:hypothetical protein